MALSHHDLPAADLGSTRSARPSRGTPRTRATASRPNTWRSAFDRLPKLVAAIKTARKIKGLVIVANRYLRLRLTSINCSRSRSALSCHSQRPNRGDRTSPLVGQY